MTEQQFQNQMGRLFDQFGKAAYSTERMRILWIELKSHPEDVFKRIVDKFIGEFRVAPLLPDFREAVARDREKVAAQQPQISVKNELDWKDTCTLEQWVVRMIRERMTDTAEYKAAERFYGKVRFDKIWQEFLGEENPRDPL